MVWVRGCGRDCCRQQCGELVRCCLFRGCVLDWGTKKTIPLGRLELKETGIEMLEIGRGQDKEDKRLGSGSSSRESELVHTYQ